MCNCIVCIILCVLFIYLYPYKNYSWGVCAVAVYLILYIMHFVNKKQTLCIDVCPLMFMTLEGWNGLTWLSLALALSLIRCQNSNSTQSTVCYSKCTCSFPQLQCIALCWRHNWGKQSLCSCAINPPGGSKTIHM